MTQKKSQQIEYVLSTHAIERLFPSKEAVRLCERMSDGTLSAKEAVASVLKAYGLKQGADHG